MRSGAARRRYTGRCRRSVGSTRLVAKAEAAEAMAVAARSTEVVMEARGTAVTGAAKREAEKEEAAAVESRSVGWQRR